jgi:hypothetical protein
MTRLPVREDTGERLVVSRDLDPKVQLAMGAGMGVFGFVALA